MWLTGRLVRDHKTIADFRKDNGLAIRKVCARFVAVCRELGKDLADVRGKISELVEKKVAAEDQLKRVDLQQ
jgi:hypothetical protein